MKKLMLLLALIATSVAAQPAPKAVLNLRVAQGGAGPQLVWEWDHARPAYEGCASPASGTNCVGSFEWGLVEVDANGVSTLRRIGVVDAVASATTRQSYSTDIALPAGIGTSQFYVRALGYDRKSEPTFGRQAQMNVTVVWDMPENARIQ